jgi:hypothetical protein
MKLIRKTLLTLTMGFLAVSQTFAQKVEVENTYDISGKAKRGELAYAEQLENGDYALYYQLPTSSRKYKIETYFFDSDFRFKSMEEYEEDVDKIRVKYKWFKGVAENTEYKLMRVESNLGGQLVLKYGRLKYRYDWNTGGRYWDWITDEKIKPKDQEGRKLSLISYVTDEPSVSVVTPGWVLPSVVTAQEATGNLTLFCNVVNSIKDMKSGDVADQPWAMIEYSAETKQILDEKYFGKAELGNRCQSIVYQKQLSNGNYGMVYAATGGGPLKKYQNLAPTDFQYIEVSFKDKKIVRSIPFTSGDSYWKINSVEIVGNDVYIHGVGVDKKNTKYYNELALKDKGKYTNYQIVKISGDKLAWVSKTNLTEFATKLKTPPSQKKTPEFTGQNFKIGSFTVSKSGEIFVNGQNVKEGPKYKDLFVFHFGNDGKLKAQYGVDIKENNKISDVTQTECLFLESQDGKTMSWLIREMVDYKNDGRLLSYARIATISTANATISDFVSLGQDGKEKYYLSNDCPILPSKSDSKMTFFGADRSGKTIWFCRVVY